MPTDSAAEPALPASLRALAVAGLVALAVTTWLLGGHELLSVAGTAAVLTFAALGGRTSR